MTTCAFSKQTISMPAASFSPETTPSLVSPQSTDHSTSECKKPRKNRSAYTLFALDIKPKLKANSSLKMSCVDLQTTISQLWKDLPADERKKYQDQANEEKLHYMLKLKKFYENASPETLEEATKPKPKRPYSAYCYFVKEIRHIIKIPDAKFKMQEILKQASERWRMLTEEEKAVYHEKAKQARENYHSEAVDPSEALIEESIDAAEFAFEPQETKKKVPKKESKTPSTNKKRGLHFSKDIREKMEKLDRQSPVKKVKPDFFTETHSNLGLFTPKERVQSVKLETFICKAPCLEEPSKLEVKQESMESELLKPIPIKVQQNQFWPNMGVPQMWNLEMPPVNPNVNLMGEFSLAMGLEQARRQMMNQLLMRKIGQMTFQQNMSSLFGNNKVEVKAESL